ncbi:MAG TPA: NAD(P)H-dependent glycerol-3-phosphate dehydrogenase [Chitinivibrionales bacterium]|nr:NAD(P)H-dependent glycerol-3-phosphate dehydrogenase [Chitinivibrionales bacterium]
MNIAILGGGSWSIALSVLLAGKNHAVRMWEFDKNDAAMLARQREHPKKLPGIKIPPSVAVTNDIREALESAEYVLCVVPSQTTRNTCKTLVAAMDKASLDKIKGWIIASKGIECGTLKIMSEVLVDEIPGLSADRIVVLSGPSLAAEVSHGIPTTVVAASTNLDLAKIIQKEFSTHTFRIYTNTDVKGVELAASIKNVIALAAGICDGLGLGANTKGALLTRGMAEIVRLGIKMGAQEQTFFGLAGMGDLITTCTSTLSRNHTMGELIASGLSLKEALSRTIMVAEGVETARSVHELAKKYGIVMPISEEVYKVLFEGTPVKETIKNLMLREHRPERWG